MSYLSLYLCKVSRAQAGALISLRLPASLARALTHTLTHSQMDTCFGEKNLSLSEQEEAAAAAFKTHSHSSFPELLEEVQSFRKRRHKVAYFHHPDVPNFHYGPNHPMKPHRLALTDALVRGFGLDEFMDCAAPAPANTADLLRFHSQEYIEFIDRVGGQPSSKSKCSIFLSVVVGVYLCFPFCLFLFHFCLFLFSCFCLFLFLLLHSCCR